MPIHGSSLNSPAFSALITSSLPEQQQLLLFQIIGVDFGHLPGVFGQEIMGCACAAIAVNGKTAQ